MLIENMMVEINLRFQMQIFYILFLSRPVIISLIFIGLSLLISDLSFIKESNNFKSTWRIYRCVITINT